MRVYLEGIGIWACGLEGWAEAAPALAGGVGAAPGPLSLPISALLPANERRRAVSTVKLALLVGAEAFESAGRDPRDTATVFASSTGDGDTVHHILEALAAAQHEVSPTRFHNSVHNAPSGYWTIATGTHQPTTSLCAFDASFTAALLDAAAQATVDERAVGLIAYDLPYPEPLHAARPIGSVFGVALVIAPAPSKAAIACLTVTLERATEAPTAMADPRLEAMRVANPAARSLPLLEALARQIDRKVVLDHVGGNAVMVSIAQLPSSAMSAP
jgi:hypothetical protein